MGTAGRFPSQGARAYSKAAPLSWRASASVPSLHCCLTHSLQSSQEAKSAFGGRVINCAGVCLLKPGSLLMAVTRRVVG